MFGALAFRTVQKDNVVGQNGLPVTPAATNVIGRFQRLKRLRHPHLCQYLDICHGHRGTLVFFGHDQA